MGPMVLMLTIVKDDALGANSLGVNHSKGQCIGGPRVSLLTIVEDSAMRDVYYTTGRCKEGS